MNIWIRDRTKSERQTNDMLWFCMPRYYGRESPFTHKNCNNYNGFLSIKADLSNSELVLCGEI